jgi:predicted acylesterase/phospholipase RssA/CRP-like cAMP-binding protein
MSGKTTTQIVRPVTAPGKSVVPYPGLLRMFGEDEEVRARFEAEANRLLVPGGHTLFERGDPADHLYIVIHGRLHVLRPDAAGANRLVGEVGTGEICGERSLLSGDPRSATVRATRDTELFELSREGFDRIVASHPHAMRYVARVLTERIVPGGTLPRARGTVSTIAIVPLHPMSTLSRFSQQLTEALTLLGTVVRLDSAEVNRRLGPGAAELRFDAAGGPEIIAGLHSIEDEGRFVVYEGDPQLTEWSRKCIRQADRLILLAEAGAEPGQGKVDAYLRRREEQGRAAERDLVLLDSREGPAELGRWMSGRHLRAHHHIDPGSAEEINRLARMLAGAATGVVLSGGGARTLAHIGVIRAIREAGIPIDYIGGTSGGAIVAAQVAMGWDDERMARENRKHFVEGGGLLDLGLPFVSLIKGRRFKRMLMEMFGETRIEDLRLPFYCVTTNLSRGEMDVHEDGLLWRWVRGSISVPGLGPPLVEKGELHVDGSVLNNLPIDIMRAKNPGTIIGVSVGSRHGPRLPETHMKVPSRLTSLRDRLFGGEKASAAPGIIDILFSATMISGQRASKAFEADADLMIFPDVDRWEHLDFAALEGLDAEGYRAAKAALEGWERSTLPG